MIKKNDVVVDYKRRILHVEGIHKDGAETFVLARVYRSQKRVAVPMSSVKKHPFFSWHSAVNPLDYNYDIYKTRVQTQHNWPSRA